MNPVLHDLRLWDSLKRYVRCVRKLALEVDELRRRAQPTFDLDAQEVRPERRQALRIRAVDLYPADPSDGLTIRAGSHASRDYPAANDVAHIAPSRRYDSPVHAKAAESLLAFAEQTVPGLRGLDRNAASDGLEQRYSDLLVWSKSRPIT
jgi:hypothetical protein